MTNIMTQTSNIFKIVLGAISVTTVALSTTASAADYYAPVAYASAPTLGSPAASNEIVGHPYTVAGVTYTPRHDASYDMVGNVSWYGDRYQGKMTASGETFDKNALTAAHKTLPINSMVRVTNMTTGQSLVVRINDRGPFVGNGIIDLSEAAALRLGYATTPLGAVRVQYVTPAKAAYRAPTPPSQRYAEPQRAQAPYGALNGARSMMPQTTLPAAPVAIPRAEAPASSQTTLTIKGQVHMATSKTYNQPRFIRAVNRVTYTTK